MNYVLQPPARPDLPVAGTDERFPVGQVFCVGRNYADHAVEMGGDPDREPPFFFIKPGFTVLADGLDMIYPELSSDVHHELEMVVAIGGTGRNVTPDDAMKLVFGYGVGIDMTRRDLQAEAKEKSRPWEAGKSFVGAAPCGAITRVNDCGHIEDAEMELVIDGAVKQSGNVSQMIWKTAEILSRLSALFVLGPGDLVFTGTPAGVGPVHPGNKVQANISGLSELVFKISSS